jgi:hypothetical protein
MNINIHPPYVHARRAIAVGLGCAFYLAAISNARATAVVTTASGPLASDIQPAVNNFRTSIALGGVNNGVGGGPLTNGFRNINWDGVGDAFSDPNLLPETSLTPIPPRPSHADARRGFPPER